ncbi:hypothetical protein POM88_021620 [Heracleum sosnowskyi]|uniref:NAC domain-containing protein n=1 Tax=Heracleum sosnowskyi TaxID=360622 RepID=A0AAD8IDU3_9APIA|nr:hypothetical protein POM88_021620 [Heracleum sosnowskyi]
MSSNCYRFNPFEHELITVFLKPKILGQNLPCDDVKETQLYATNPWQVFPPKTHPWILSEVSAGKFEMLTYVFVNLTKKAVDSNKKKIKFNGGCEQFIRKTGCGTWDGKTKRTEIRDFDDNLVGERKMLAFKITDISGLEDFSRLGGHWRMHEYSLCGVNSDISNPDNTVLCKITLDPFKTPQLNPSKTIHPIKPTVTQRKNDDVVTTQSCCDGGFVSNEFSGSKREEEKDFCFEIDEEWFKSIYASEEGECVNFESPRYPEQLIDDFTTLGKRKLHVESSFAIMTHLCFVETLSL